jgi:superfamily I DNA/RNA helicase
MSVVFSKDFHKDLEVDGSLKSKAWDFVRKLSTDADLTGLDLKQPQGALDKRVRTARVDLNYRAVLFDMSTGGQSFYLLAAIKPHDDAYALAVSLELRVNPVNGIAEILRHQDVREVVRRQTQHRAQASRDDGSTRLLPYTVAELTGIGLIDEIALRAVELTDDDGLQELCLAVPEWQGDALLQLAYGSTLDEVRRLYGPADDTTVALDDLGKAFEHPAAQMQFVVVTEDNDDELRAMLEGDFHAWRTFLHPDQRAVAYREKWNGAFRLSGGAGTGKTVVAIHRAAFLSRQGRPRVLLTTFTKTLAAQLEAGLAQLAGPGRISHVSSAAEPGTVRVSGVDSIARAIVAKADGHVPKVITDQEADRRWEEAARDLPDLTPAEANLLTVSFLGAEYRNVVLAQEITDRQGYLKASRKGRGVRLNWLQRTRVWAVLDLFTRRLEIDGATTFTALVARAARILTDPEARSRIDTFDHVIVDEGQDLHATHWLMLRRLVSAAPNDLFICEDSHQRIYGERLTLSHYGIDVRGRSRKLTLNYRTTRQNLRFALQVLDGGQIVDLEGDNEDRTGYRSLLSGPEPTLRGVADTAAEHRLVAETIAGWLAEPAPTQLVPDSIGVLVRTNRSRDDLARALRQTGLEIETLAGDSEATHRGVRIATMHRAKGMEFARVVVAGVSDDVLPSQWLLDSTAEEDRGDVEQRERLLLYVACTRARDQLLVTWCGVPSRYLPAESRQL